MACSRTFDLYSTYIRPTFDLHSNSREHRTLQFDRCQISMRRHKNIVFVLPHIILLIICMFLITQKEKAPTLQKIHKPTRTKQTTSPIKKAIQNGKMGCSRDLLHRPESHAAIQLRGHSCIRESRMPQPYWQTETHHSS